MTRTVWLDVEDLFDYALSNPRPSGIQRLTFEVYSALVAAPQHRAAIRFVRHDPQTGFIRAVPWADVAALYETLVREKPASRPRAAEAAPLVAAPPHRPKRKLVPMPQSARAPLTRYKTLQGAAWHELKLLFGARPAAPSPAQPPDAPETEMADADAAETVGVETAVLETAALPAPKLLQAPVAAASQGVSSLGAPRLGIQPGDVLLTLGATWFRTDYGALMRRARDEFGMRTALLCYDLIPLRHPEWCAKTLVSQFAAWFDGVAPACDTFFAISDATARDLVAYCAGRYPNKPVTVRTIPIGSGFTSQTAARQAPSHAAARSREAHPATPAPGVTGLPAPGSYVLFVSTIEARKNHALLFRVWQKLLDEFPAHDVPDLVLAGRVGWLVSDLMRQIVNSRYLNGKIRLIEDPSDAAIEDLYKDALFSVFPSLSEGWGLPVTESLMLGTPCVISNATSLPEAGGAFARYFDPNSVQSAFGTIRATLQDRAGLAAWQAQIRREFRPTPWSATASALIDGLFDDGAAPRDTLHVEHAAP